nr:hemocytin isoform X2 [Plodia interpunctella]
MNLLLQGLIFLLGFIFCDGGYGVAAPSSLENDPQSDVQAPEYLPPNLKNAPEYTYPSVPADRSYRYTKNRYSGTKTSYGGTKTGYSGIKNSYSGTKTGYHGTKTGYTGTKTGYTGTKNGYSNAYGEKRTWYSHNNAPTYQEFYGNANEPYKAKCDPDCKNNGICIDTNTCQCPVNYHGRYCEFERKPCLVYPPLPMNSKRNCSNDFCTVQCREGHKFIDGSTIANMRCVDGQWQPTRADFTTIPDCLPECDPPCQNGGVCLSLNTCQCPDGYRGPACQYSTSVCDMRKLAFNGGYSCFGDHESFSCKLRCPSGSTFSSPPATLYTCKYNTGVFEPQPVPHCVFKDVMVITPSNYHNRTYESSTSWNSSTSSSSHSYGYSMTEHGEGKYIGGSGGSSMTVVIEDLSPKGGTCLTWAGVHYKTFDGKIYSFQSPCQHILVRDAIDHKYTIAVRHGECKDKVFCPSELTIYLEDKPYILAVGEDGTVAFRSTKRMIPMPASLPGIRVAMPGDFVLVNLDAAGVTVKWDTENLILVEGTVQLWNSTEGLCGSLDGSAANDLKTKEGATAMSNTAMAADWQLNKIGDICESNPTEVNACSSKSDADMKKALQFCTKIFSKDKFRKCSKVMDVSMLLETCQWDYCACATSLSPEECACRTVSVYAKECLRHGVEEMKAWRDEDTCPVKCPEGKVYKACGPDSQASCALPQLAGKVDNATCSEGCYCPHGLLLEGGRCVPSAHCPCRLRNRSFKPGQTIKKECNTCTCQSGEWTCTQVACGARCSAVGDPHYTTFDGLRYDFMGHCTYNLLKSDNFTIEVENVACSGAITEALNLAPYKGEGKPSCTKAVSISFDGVDIHLKQGGFILVNGKEVTSLPVTVGKVRIRAASSLFVIVQLPIKVDVWWDGQTRVFVDVPPTLQGKTQGLCGTFNLNQKDDFLTPEGDVEQSTLAFANKWKTRELCDDVMATEPEHPCKANVENKEAAEKYCSRLKTTLFSECHWYVDVEPYYEACLYDMCACAGDVSKCLCPIIGDYAMACAQNGVKVQWRYNVKECELQCAGGQEYTVCADSCLRQCTDLALVASGTSDCKPCCVEGCACPPGQLLDDSGVCVPVGLCPCYHKGMKFDAEYKEVRPGRRERELCTCVGGVWECVPATPADVAQYPPAEDLRSNCSATKNMEFTTCEIAEPLTCKNMHLPPSSTSEECRPGCQCKKGFVLDTSSKQCVLASACPCHHGGRSYPDGHKMQEECNTCECKSGNWSCSERKCAGVCAAWGDSHVVTFDGADYDFEGVCTYLLAKGSMDADDGFVVEIQNVPCGTTGATCSKSVVLKVGTPGSEEVVSLTRNSPLPDTTKLKRIKLRLAGAYVFLDVPSLGVSLQWDRELRVYVKVDSLWQGRVKGLCGNYNADTRDDFQTPSGGGMAESSPLIFADSWKLKSTCPKPQPVGDHCKQRPERNEWATATCGSLKRFPFSLCHSEVPADKWLQRCEKDACACDAGGDCACACAALAAYAHACAMRGVTFKWRTPELCPMQCDEECSNYDACVSPCPLETCDNTMDYADLNTQCGQDACVEGCKPKNSCPEGSVYSNSSLTECVPRAKCKPVCMTLEDGTEVPEGGVIEEDACHSCRCSKKHKVCTGQPCSTVAPTATITATSPKPHDEPLKCASGWSDWVSKHTPEVNAKGQSVDLEPLPEHKDFQIGSPMCKPDMMTKIECRTKVNHQTPKQTGLDVECSLERGLVCRETGNTCPDFEIRVYCQCEEEFQCLNADHPSYPHPKNCAQFYECTPDLMHPDKPHTALKNCAEGTLYNPNSMVCDWPSTVFEIRPECKNETGKLMKIALLELPTTPQTYPDTTFNFEPVRPRPRPCAAGRALQPCAFPCDQLCDHFLHVLNDRGLCRPGEKCADACVEESEKEKKCGKGLMWRDEKTCVPVKDCTCYSEGKVIKPGGVITSDCMKCQCLNNDLHCDTSDCLSTPLATTHERLIATNELGRLLEFTETPTTEATTTEKPTTVQVPSTTNTPLIVVSTTSPPPECSPDSYKRLLWGDQPLSDSAFTASSISNDFFKPQNAILDGSTTHVSAGSWTPEVMDQQQYIQVEFPHPEPIYGVVVQGSPIFDQYVTSYELMYGDDANVFSKVNDADGKPKVFRGPVDHKKAMKQMLEPPIEAKFLRLRPLTWHKDIAVRFEVIGCQEPKTTEELTTTTVTPSPIQCTEPLGLAADLPVENIEVSSNNDARQYFQLQAERGWRPAYSTPGEWIMFDFMAPRNITGIKTKGGPKGWVTAYNVMYTSDLNTFNPVIDSDGSYKLFPANFDSESVVTNEFRLPIHARYLKVLPLKWKDAIEMRIEPIGCFEPYPTPTTVAPEISSAAPCSLCPGVPAPVTTQSCACAAPQYYDGENCVSRDQCPCVEGFISYSVGSSFRGSNCDECVCKLGGVTDCKPVKECLCAPDLVPKLSETTCECLCSPCPNTTKICPTSKLCLPLEKWCDGLQDCPDDELGCTTSTTTVTIEPTVVTTVAPSAAAMISTTVPVTTVTTPKPVECPPVECPPGYLVRYTSAQSVYTDSELPPPRPRYSYQRYFRGGPAKGSGGGGGYSKGGYSKGGYSKGGFSKGGYGGGYGQPTAAPQTDRFTLAKPTITNHSQPAVCPQFKCVPKLPPPPKPGLPPAARVCATPACPPRYSLKLDGIADDQCPQYVCAPPAERPAWCNVTGRTFNTFDGAEYKYDVCFHILARDNKFDAWSVLVRKKCRVEGCQNELIVHQDDQLIVVKPNLMIEYDNYEYTVEQTSKICFQKNSFDVDKLGNGLAIKSRKYNITVLYTTDGDIKIGVPTKYKGSVDGMCGAYDGDARNERRSPTGAAAASLELFGRSWARPGLPRAACRTALVSQETQRRAWALCDVITHEPFSKCGKVLNLDKWRTICLEKICECEKLVINGTKRTSEECRCLLLETLVGECMAADRDVNLEGWRMQMDCPAECPPPLVHSDCYRKRCEPACSTLGPRRCPSEDGHCFPGCYCPEGMLRKGDQCIPPADCLDCTCKGVGTPASYTTFQGDEFPFLGNCTYLASRDRNETGHHKYQVYATNGPCEGKTDVTCTKAVHVIYDKNVIHITKDPNTKKLQMTKGETPVFKFPLSTDWMTADLLNKQDLSLMLIDIHVQVIVEQSKMEFSVKLPTHLYSNRTEGLCGACGGSEPVLLTRNGTVTDDVDEFGSSWQASAAALAALGAHAHAHAHAECGAPSPPPPCVPPPSESNPCYTLFNPDIFGACHALVDPQSYVESCSSDLCALNSTDACDTMRRYASACAGLGVCLDWRTKAKCPYECHVPLVYQPCVKCERTCENYDELKQNPDKCEQPVVEGCYCPQGQVRVNNTCIEASKCFPCDAKKEHYAGDEWQEDACTKCTCSKLSSENAAHVSCTTQTCTTPVCSNDEDLVTKHSDATRCCKDYMCVPKPKDNTVCDEPKKIVCGAGQVLKQKTTPNGCQEFACECKPASECEPLPNENEVEIMEAGMERLVDRSGCCPTVQMVCRKDTCPEKPECPKFHTLKTLDVGKCCPEYKCEIPKDKCIVNLEWEAAPRGGEKARDVPEVVLKDLGSVWLDGPCRSCRCSAAEVAGAEASARSRCVVSACAAPPWDAQLVWEPRAVPFACCARYERVACRHGGDVYRVGENWTSPYNPCESYRCEQLEDGKLEKVTTVKHCDEDCPLGSKYIPAEADSKQCCGKCKPVACAVRGSERRVGEEWASQDFCTRYSCVDVNGTLQVQSSDETCPEISEAVRKQFVLKEEKVPGKCCPTSEPVACRVGNKIYQEGQTYPTSDPCKNMTCSRDENNKLAHVARVQTCDNNCRRGWVYKLPAEGECCGRCVQDKCVLDDELKTPGEVWYSADNCTTYSCDKSGEEVQVSASRQSCPDVSGCDARDLVNGTCCVVCVEKPQALSTCVPKPIRSSDTIMMVRVHLGPHGLCVNKEPIKGLNECKGYCDSGTTFSNATSSHTSSCSCCQAVRYAALTVALACADGSRQQHRLAAPASCSCRGCGAGSVLPDTAAGPSNTKTGYRHGPDSFDYEIPEIYQRFGSPKPPRSRR